MATMLDEGLARCCFAALPSKVGVTARLEIDFRRPTKCEGSVVLKARTQRVEGRKAWVKGRVEVLPTGEGDAMTKEGKGEVAPYDEKGEVLVEAEGLFVEPKWAKVSGLRPVTFIRGKLQGFELTQCANRISRLLLDQHSMGQKH